MLLSHEHRSLEGRSVDLLLLIKSRVGGTVSLGAAAASEAGTAAASLL